MACTRWSSLVCFGGVGAGEVVTGRRAQGGRTGAASEPDRVRGSTVPAYCAGIRRPWSGFWPSSRTNGGRRSSGLRSAVAGAADLADELGVPAPEGRTLAYVPDRLPAVRTRSTDRLVALHRPHRSPPRPTGAPTSPHLGRHACRSADRSRHRYPPDLGLSAAIVAGSVRLRPAPPRIRSGRGAGTPPSHRHIS